MRLYFVYLFLLVGSSIFCQTKDSLSYYKNESLNPQAFLRKNNKAL